MQRYFCTVFVYQTEFDKAKTVHKGHFYLSKTAIISSEISFKFMG